VQEILSEVLTTAGEARVEAAKSAPIRRVIFMMKSFGIGFVLLDVRGTCKLELE